MNLFVEFSLIGSVVSAIITVYLFIKEIHRGSSQRKVVIVFSVVTGSMLLLAWLLTYIPTPASAGSNISVTKQGTTTVGRPGSGEGTTPTPTQPPTPTIEPSATVADGLITKNLTLPCSSCNSDPVHVTINTIQIDNANGRMIWDTSLRDVTGSGRGFSYVKYDLQANGSQTMVDAVLSQTQFSGNQADMQAIFAFVPSPGVSYTLTIVVNWAYNTSGNIYFDPVKLSF